MKNRRRESFGYWFERGSELIAMALAAVLAGAFLVRLDAELSAENRLEPIEMQYAMNSLSDPPAGNPLDKLWVLLIELSTTGQNASASGHMSR